MKWINIEKIKYFLKEFLITISGMIFVTYFIIISRNFGRIDDFTKVMFGIGFLWIIVSIKKDNVYAFFKKLPRIIRRIIKFSILLFALSFITLEIIIIANMKTTAAPGADYVLILGCQVNGSIPSIPLKRRVNIAIRYLNENKNSNVIVTGGKGPGESITESSAMKNMLIQNGIDEKRIFEENKAKNTMENFRYSNELYGLTDKNIVVVSHDYHMYRALSIAKKLHYKTVKALPCKSQMSVLPVYLLREGAAVAYYILLRRI